MYARLLSATPGVTGAKLGALFKDASFGIAPGGQQRAYSPTHGLTITRDAAFGVPHVYGATRAAAMFGVGYAAAEDRLFLMDALRHTGRGQLSAFAGGAAGNRRQDAQQWALAPYTEADLERQVDQLDDLYGAEGRQLQDDAASYVAGINKYIAEARLDVTKMPGEYAGIGRPGGAEPWKVTDVVATASLAGGIFGKGGGDELTQMELRRSFIARYGARRGTRLWREWAAYEDADAPTTVRGTRFPYQTPPKRPARGGLALADAGSLRSDARRRCRDGPAAARPARRRCCLPAAADDGDVERARSCLQRSPRAAGRSPSSGRRPGTSRRRSSWSRTSTRRGSTPVAPRFPGVNLYVLLGRGRDYAWSATSAGQDIIDTFALELCEPDGARPTLESMHYRFRGACLPIEVLDRVNEWSPTLADSTRAGIQRLRAERTKLGLVAGRATISGAPVIYTRLRSTYMHEVDSALGFSDFNDPAKMRDARDFQRIASKIGYTFNWLYVDDRDIAYFNSGNNPQRAPGVTGQLPTPARMEWRGFDPDSNTAAYTSFAKHPQAINGQPYMTSWNNKPARGYAGADSALFSSVYRSQMLDKQIETRIAGRATIDLPGLVEAMGEAATTDLRAQKVLPLALRVIGAPRDPKLADAVSKLARVGRRRRAPARPRRRRALRARRRDPDPRRALAALAARAVRAVARRQAVRSAGSRARARQRAQQPRRPPRLGVPDAAGTATPTRTCGACSASRCAQPYSKRYCGGGSRARCRSALRGALARALTVDAATLYRDDTCAAAGRPGDQVCFDSIAFRATGGITQPLIGWQNRPTYQQVAVEVQGHRPAASVNASGDWRT